MTPYLPSLEWWMQRHNGSAAFSRRELMRCLIRSNQGDEPLRLSVPIAGGSSSIKRLNPEEWILSEHDRWNHRHIHALHTAYSRTPYFSHYFPALEEILLNPPRKASGLCLLTDRCIRHALHYDSLRQEMDEFKKKHPKLVENTINDLRPRISEKLSIVDALFRLGPDTIFLFYAR